MNKSEFIDALAGKTGLSKKDSKVAIEAFVEVVTEALKAGDSVNLIGFGTFSITKRDERVARVPSTGKEIKVPASNYPKFKAGKALKDAVN